MPGVDEFFGGAGVMAKRKGSRDSFVVAGKVRDYVRSNRCFASSELVDGLNRQVGCLLASAVQRAKANKRKTVRSCDI